MKNPQEILKELIKEAADNVDGKFDYTSDPTTIVAERFAQQYIDANKELVEMLEEFTNAVETEEIIIKENYDNDGWENCGNRLYEKAKSLITKHKQS